MVLSRSRLDHTTRVSSPLNLQTSLIPSNKTSSAGPSILDPGSTDPVFREFVFSCPWTFFCGFLICECVARRTCHRVCSSRTSQLSMLVFMLLQASLSRSAATKSVKKNYSRARFSRIREEQMMIVRHFRGSGLPVLQV